MALHACFISELKKENSTKKKNENGYMLFFKKI